MDEPKNKTQILQLSTSDSGGGAERVAWSLFQSFRQLGRHSRLMVGTKTSDDSDVTVIPNDEVRNWWARLWIFASNTLKPFTDMVPGFERLRRLMVWNGQPLRYIKLRRGYEDFDFPGTWHLLKLIPDIPDIVHCHNLHGNYFDLRILPWLSQKIPVVLTLHDAWLLSGHCAHSFECERWRTGCGHCPDLKIYPPIKRDATNYNWRRKRDIYSRSRLFISTPSRWLMDKVENSILSSGIVETRVINNGVDLNIFYPSNQQLARELLGLPIKAKIILFVANGIRQNIWKDYETMTTAIAQVAEQFNAEDIIFLALGEDAPTEYIGKAKIQFVPYQKDQSMIANFYQSADIYIHAARADTFPNTVLEALACGVPVVATSVGGIPEQVDDGQTGFLTPPGNAEAMATRIVQLLNDNDLRSKFSYQAAETAHNRFDLNRQVKNYLSWYCEILERWNAKSKIRVAKEATI